MWVIYDKAGTASPQYWEEKLLSLFLLPGNRFVSLLKDTWMFQFLIKNIPKGSLVLDLGSGSGFSSHVLKEHGLKIFGIDYSFQLVKRCSETHGSERYLCGDIRRLPFKSNTFDAVVSISS